MSLGFISIILLLYVKVYLYVGFKALEAWFCECGGHGLWRRKGSCTYRSLEGQNMVLKVTGVWNDLRQSVVQESPLEELL